MSNDDQKLILSAALVYGLGLHLGAWMARDGEGAGTRAALSPLTAGS
jgi:hypothetical protein